MLYRLPKAMPPLCAMVDDIGNPHPRDLARALGVSTRTVYHWLKHDNAPRPVLLSLFWVTRWGHQWLDTDLFNLMRLQTGLADARARELARLHAQVAATTENVPQAPHSPKAERALEGPPMLYLVR